MIILYDMMYAQGHQYSKQIYGVTYMVNASYNERSSMQANTVTAPYNWKSAKTKEH